MIREIHYEGESRGRGAGRGGNVAVVDVLGSETLYSPAAVKYGSATSLDISYLSSTAVSGHTADRGLP